MEVLTSSLCLAWRPLSLNPIILMSVIAFTLFLIVILAILQSKSKQDGGVLFADDIAHFPAGFNFLYLYLPTIIAVFYTTMWNWIDLDVKRVEPWHQLSKGTPSAAAESLLLQYPVEFLASVPISSMKRRSVIISFNSELSDASVGSGQFSVPRLSWSFYFGL